jgi:hypothetical protein
MSEESRASGRAAEDDTICCEEFRSAVEVTFAVPIDGPTGWLLYGTDAETVAVGLPELRYWAASFCPFCGAALQPSPERITRARRFGFTSEDQRTSAREPGATAG